MAESDNEFLIPVKNVFINVADKSNLDYLLRNLAPDDNSSIHYYSGGITYHAIKEILKDGKRLSLLDEFTDFPKSKGDSSSPFHPVTLAGISGDRNNEKVRELINSTGNGVFFDMVVGNFIPFEHAIAKPNMNAIEACRHIAIQDISILRAVAANYKNCLVVSEPGDYESVIKHLKENKGSSSRYFRLEAAHAAFRRISRYDHSIADYIMEELNFKSPAVISRFHDPLSGIKS